MTVVRQINQRGLLIQIKLITLLKISTRTFVFVLRTGLVNQVNLLSVFAHSI